MTSLFTKRKMFIIATCLFLVTMSTVLFLVGEESLNVNSHELKAFVLQDEQIDIVQNEDFYKHLLKTDESEFFILKKDTTIHYSTEKWRENFGYLLEDVEKKNFFTFVHPKDLPFFANVMVELVNEGTEHQSIGPFRIKDNAGQYKLYMADGIPLTDKHNDIVGIALILKDVSIPLGGSSAIPGAMAFAEGSI